MGKAGPASPEVEGAGHCQAQSDSSPASVHRCTGACRVLGVSS